MDRPSTSSHINRQSLPNIDNLALSMGKSEMDLINIQIRSEEHTPQSDLAAMSVASLYQRSKDLDLEMNTFEDANEKSTAPISEVESLNDFHDTLLPSNGNLSRQFSQDKPRYICPKANLYFNDGIRSVDFILVWDSNYDQAVTESAMSRRSIFENNLIKEGLELEYERTDENGLNFIKVHAPKQVLRRYSEILKLRMPMKKELCSVHKADRVSKLLDVKQFITEKIPGMQDVQARTNIIINGFKRLITKITSTIKVDEKMFPERGHRFTAVYSRDKEYLFDLESPCFFTPAIHSRIVQFILDRKRFSDDEDDDFAFGIERLISDYTYAAAYPLHDGSLHTRGSMRHRLYDQWARLKKWYRYQPLDYIKEYFGVKIALYFAWLGFYTAMLLPAAIVGIACFTYSLLTLNSDIPSQDICDKSSTVKMCPLCDYWCDYWELKDTCIHAKITYLFDNPTTVFFAFFMSFWATLFLELWKRYSAEITHRWDLTGFDVKEEHPRPQYLARLAHVKRRQMNIVTNTMEPLVPFWSVRLPATILSFSVVLLLIALALATVIAVVLYRMSVLTALSWWGHDTVITSYAILFTTATSASLNLCCIMILNWVYEYVAELLTEVELLRTQTEFDDSLTLKIYLLQFVNYYASIFYIAFFKGKLVGYPGNYNRLFGHRQEECGFGGCLLELSIQLAIIMIGKQAMNAVLEMFMPKFYQWFYATTKIKTKKDSKEGQLQWLQDYELLNWGSRGLFPEYLEMVLQYGFVTIFVAAFPLAPFFALVNNVLEMRLDAIKLLTFYRRPVTQRVRSIGVWYRILDSIGKISVITNGFIIAFTSDFIPRLVYRLYVNESGTLDGYLNASLSYFNTNEFNHTGVHSASPEVQICRYPDYREPPWADKPYDKTTLAWHILAARLAFVVAFENLVAVVMIFVRWGIPDVPQELNDRIRRETYITNEIIIKQEMLIAQTGNISVPKDDNELRGFQDCPSTPTHWDHLIRKSLSASEFDLIVHAAQTRNIEEELEGTQV